LLVGHAGRPDLHARGEHTVENMAGALGPSLTARLLTLPDHLLLYPAHHPGRSSAACSRAALRTRSTSTRRSPSSLR
jgi:glyoxylase-like metal-dependent hydrolase (beta-lactamase superfamily II)